MGLVLSDKALAVNFSANSQHSYINLAELKISNCLGCFGCWVKTPGKCVIRDDATRVYPVIAKNEELIYVSKLKYGGYDIPMKTMLERAIPIQQAFIRLVDGEAHHVQRDVPMKTATIIAYGDVSIQEQAIFERLVARNAHNMNFKSFKVIFTTETQLETVVQGEIEAWKKS